METLSEREAFNAYHDFTDRTMGVRRRVRTDQLAVGDVFASGEKVAAVLAATDFLNRPAVFLTIEKRDGSTYGRTCKPSEKWAVA